MTAEFEKARRYPDATNQGIASSQSPLSSAPALRRKLRPLPLNDVQEFKCAVEQL